ncbi:hypothetical protein BGX20_010491 [Mortierella sp. AD010]|nr:hypothetical protein BGX20_010491 [Mortierella sp. AD010]
MASRKGWENMILSKGEGDAPDDFLNFSELIFDFMHGNDDKLTYDESEVVSNASSARKNFLRSLEDRQANGLKVDGILYLSGAKIEIGAMEAGKEDEGQYGTKFLVDSVKLAKLLKDMFDFACTQAGGNGSDVIVMINKLEVYGFLISGLRIEFVSLKYLGGRHFYFNREGDHSLPDLLNDDAVAKISRLAKQFLIWRFLTTSKIRDRPDFTNTAPFPKTKKN